MSCTWGREDYLGEMVRILNTHLRMILQKVLPGRLTWVSPCQLDPVARGSQALCLENSNGFSLHLE